MSDQAPIPPRSARKAAERRDETYLPPRMAVHPTEKGKWTKIFYLTLLWLFISLVVGLTVWGVRYS
ncbi:hypothetical protein [Paenibacillus athensensis]|uniref:Uncharacterized protein n=1 Tax=Paenibacillus athensensis TaxID=1967502 RepID=A0A4Y8Q8K9_9BACL|nr:hypothetical protein [Paenibacillus athensensis]